MPGLNTHYLWLILGFLASGAAGCFLPLAFLGLLKRIGEPTPITLDKFLIKHLRTPFRWLFILLAMRSTIPLFGPSFPEGFFDPPHLGLYFFSLFIIAWIPFRFISVSEDSLVNRYLTGIKVNLYARKIVTQFMVFQRLGILLSSIEVVSVALRQFKSVRLVGIGLVRERLIGWIQHHHPVYLPWLRIAAEPLTGFR